MARAHVLFRVDMDELGQAAFLLLASTSATTRLRGSAPTRKT